MDVWRGLDDVPADLGRTVVTIGNFDGVHLGHQHVLRRCRQVADLHGGQPVVAVTFDPHPLAVLRPEHAPTLLTSIEQRAELLADAGADHAFVVPFSMEVAAWSPEEFVDRVLVPLKVAAVVVGANFRFGHRASGDVETLRCLADDRDFAVEGVPLDGGPQVWSSTYVRTCLAAGDVEGAAEALGRPYTVRGVVVEGHKRGRALGYPTANVPTSGTTAVPEDGVYAGRLRRFDESEGAWLPAAISVGSNPTFDDRVHHVESYVLDRDDLELYGVEVETSFIARLRGQETFESVDRLIAQMADDVDRARGVLGVPEPGES